MLFNVYIHEHHKDTTLSPNHSIWLGKTQDGFYHATENHQASYTCPAEPFDSDHILCYNFTETNTLYCAISDQMKYNSLDNEAYAGNSFE